MNAIVRLSGGLGNQMFQLCAGLFAVRNRPTYVVFLDYRFLANYETAREFEIGFLLKYLPGVRIYNHLSYFSALASRFRLGRLLDMTVGRRAFISSSRKLKELETPSLELVVLDGYFQHPDFAQLDAVRVSLFGHLSDEFSYLRSDLLLDPSHCLVSIHIRRGDFVTSKSASNVFKTVSLNYYKTAIQSFPPNVVFLVFGDDPTVTSEFANEVGGIDIASRGLTLQEDFMLMALCDHHIIANSTFSWWAAHLGYRPGKRVIAPRDWYVDPERSRSNPLLLPHFELLPST